MIATSSIPWVVWRSLQKETKVARGGQGGKGNESFKTHRPRAELRVKYSLEIQATRISQHSPKLPSKRLKYHLIEIIYEAVNGGTLRNINFGLDSYNCVQLDLQVLHQVFCELLRIRTSALG